MLCFFVGLSKFLNSPFANERTKKIMEIELRLCSYKYLLTPNNLLQVELWKEQGTLSIELIFIRHGLSTIYLEGMTF